MHGCHIVTTNKLKFAGHCHFRNIKELRQVGQHDGHTGPGRQPQRLQVRAQRGAEAVQLTVGVEPHLLVVVGQAPADHPEVLRIAHLRQAEERAPRGSEFAQAAFDLTRELAKIEV